MGLKKGWVNDPEKTTPSGGSMGLKNHKGGSSSYFLLIHIIRYIYLIICHSECILNAISPCISKKR